MSKYLPHGAQFTFDSIAVGGLVSIGFPDATKEEAETTDTDSGGQREFIPGLRDFGTVELTCRHDPEDAGQSALEANFLASADVKECVITLPIEASAGSGGIPSTSQYTYTFDGFVLAGPTGDLGLADSEAAQVTFTIRVTGAVAKSST